MQDVKDWFSENIERKTQLSGYNSFVAPEANYEYQLDFFFISPKDLKNQEYKGGLVLLDVFSRKAVVTPIKSKNMVDVTTGILEGMRTMGSQPKLMYSDDEGTRPKLLKCRIFSKIKRSKTIELEAILILLNDLTGLSKICYSKELMLMRKRIRIIYNGLTIWVRFY